MNKMVSIIIPVYKVELYLERCIDSVLQQTFSNMEVMLIDDGSPDSSGKICDYYKTLDSRVKVIHKRNGGLSDARNVGLKLAKGQYIIFLDADDYLEYDACEKFFKNLDEEVDIITGMFKKHIINNIIHMDNYYDNDEIIYSGNEYFYNQLKYGLYPVVAWVNVYRRKFLLENNLLFLKGYLHEDVEWTPRVFLLANKVIARKNYFYNYIIRSDSLSHNDNQLKNSRDLFSICAMISDKNLKTIFGDYIAAVYLEAFFKSGNYYIDNMLELDRGIPLSMSSKFKTKILSILFYFNPKLFLRLKRIKQEYSVYRTKI